MDDVGPALSIRLLGGFHVTVGPRLIHDGDWRLRKTKNLVKLLALAPGHRLHREQLMEVLWPDQDPDAAANNLHKAIYTADEPSNLVSRRPRLRATSTLRRFQLAVAGANELGQAQGDHRLPHAMRHWLSKTQVSRVRQRRHHLS